VTYGEFKRKLRRLGARLERQEKRHEYWNRPGTDYRSRIPRHRGEVPTGTLHAILRGLGFTQEDLSKV